MKTTYSIFRKDLNYSGRGSTRSSHLNVMTLLLMLCMICFSAGIAISQSTPRADATAKKDFYGLDHQELSDIIQQCIDLPALQKLHVENGLEALNIVQYPIALPSDITLPRSSRPVNFLTNADIPKMDSTPYFRVRSIENSNDVVKMNINYFYGNKMLSILVDLEKTNDIWNIINSNLKEYSL